MHDHAKASTRNGRPKQHWSSVRGAFQQGPSRERSAEASTTNHFNITAAEAVDRELVYINFWRTSQISGFSEHLLGSSRRLPKPVWGLSQDPPGDPSANDGKIVDLDLMLTSFHDPEFSEFSRNLKSCWPQHGSYVGQVEFRAGREKAGFLKPPASGPV